MKKYLLIGLALLLLLGLFSLLQYFKFSDGNLHIVFCNVGQGDAIVIRTPAGKMILVDSGPDNAVLDCLSDHMPFWQRTIDVAILTHPHADHFMGFFPVIERYRVRLFATEKLNNNTVGFVQLMKLLKKKEVSIRYLSVSDRFRSGGVKLTVLGPTASYLSRTSPGGLIGEREEFASLVLHVAFGTFDTLLTGDSQAEGLHNALDDQIDSKQIDVLQVPHHGSKTGLDIGIIEKIRPEIAVISVGKNKYGHPSRTTLDLLSQFKLKILRTDQHGDIEIISDGKKWRVR